MTFSTDNNKQVVLGEELGPLSDNERLKRESNLLRGTIEQDYRTVLLVALLPTTSS